jgi:hypothetical protein
VEAGAAHGARVDLVCARRRKEYTAGRADMRGKDTHSAHLVLIATCAAGSYVLPGPVDTGSLAALDPVACMRYLHHTQACDTRGVDCNRCTTQLARVRAVDVCSPAAVAPAGCVVGYVDGERMRTGSNARYAAKAPAAWDLMPRHRDGTAHAGASGGVRRLLQHALS